MLRLSTWVYSYNGLGIQTVIIYVGTKFDIHNIDGEYIEI